MRQVRRRDPCDRLRRDRGSRHEADRILCNSAQAREAGLRSLHRIRCSAIGCGKCGGETRVIGYEETEVLDMKPIEFFVTVLKREKRACGHCIEFGVARSDAASAAARPV